MANTLALRLPTRLRNVIADDRAAIVLTLSLLGDGLLYATLPTLHSEMGIPALWVGILLSVNRIVRLVAGGAITRVAERFDRRFVLTGGATAAAATTLVFAATSEIIVLVIARIVWGLTFAVLRHVVLVSATGRNAAMGRRLGSTITITQLGPLVATTLGVWLAIAYGADVGFVVLALLTMAGLILSNGHSRVETPTRVPSRPSSVRPTWPDYVAFVSGLVVDGSLVVLLVPLLTNVKMDGATTVAIAGGAQAFRQACMILLPPWLGRLADRIGLERALSYALSSVAAGLGIASCGWVIVGAGLIAIGGAGSATLAVGVAVRQRPSERSAAIRSNTFWKDLGAALGALGAGIIAPASAPFVAIAAAAAVIPAILRSRRCCPEPNVAGELDDTLAVCCV